MGIFGRLFGPPEKVKRDVEGLIKALKDKNSNVRKKAAAALVEIGEPAVKPLIEASKDEDFLIQEKAEAALRETLGKIGKPAVKPLIKALKEENFLVLDCAVEALGKIGDPKTVKPLIEVIYRLMDPSMKFDKVGFAMVQSKAAEALGKIGEPAVKPLIKALKDGRTWSYAADALGKIGKPAVIPLMQALNDEDEDVRTIAKQALRKIKARRSKK